MEVRRCGRSGLMMSPVTLGLMVRDCSPGEAFEGVKDTVVAAVDRGITSIDLATGYGGGAVESAVGRILLSDVGLRREQLTIGTKGAWADGSRKAIVGFLERSLRQLQLEYVDVYYHHAPDDGTPFEETARALADLVRQGKTRYVGVSNYSIDQTLRMSDACRDAGVMLTVHQPNYHLLNRWIEDGLLDVLGSRGMGTAVFSPLAQGLLSGDGGAIREGSRAAGTFAAIVDGVPGGEPAYGRYDGDDVAGELKSIRRSLGQLASSRGQTLSQLALQWVLRDPRVTTAIVGMSSPAQVESNAKAMAGSPLSADERRTIAGIIPPRFGLI